MLRCGDGTLYTGATCDVERRLRQHRSGRGARYTRSRLPLALVHVERVRDRGAALRREAALKQLTRAEKLGVIRQARAHRRRPARRASSHRIAAG
ncbi:MAG TPA: GIY-YIG nuclease family protein [Longimicrobiales bacterium]